MSDPIRCAHCGKVKSHRGFLKVDRAGSLGGVFCRVGDYVRIECMIEHGHSVPAERYPALIFKVGPAKEQPS